NNCSLCGLGSAPGLFGALAISSAAFGLWACAWKSTLSGWAMGVEYAARMGAAPDLDVLESIQQRVLWLATRMIHEANHVRPSADGTKVGGHQASSASVVSILTALYFGGWLRAGDRVSIKPHASPVFHAIQYLLGNLERRYLTTLRAFGG